MKSRVFMGEERDRDECLVVVFLRGGADGLSLVPPIEDDAYHRARPQLRVTATEATPLDGLFGLHPELKALEGAYRDGALAILHGAGSEDTTRSHFEAQDYMEHGGYIAGGWLGRFLRARDGMASPLSAVAIGSSQPEVLRGAPSVVVLDSFDAFTFGTSSSTYLACLEGLYAGAGGLLGGAGTQALSAVERMQQLATETYVPGNGVEYGNDDFSQGMRKIAQLIRAKAGMEAACIDLPGWDSHFTAGAIMNPLMRQLGAGLSTFYADLGVDMDRVRVVVMSEFGRRVYENASYGTDHGRGGAMFVMGGGVRGGRVLHEWAGLELEKLEGPGDVPVRYNYRDVLAGFLKPMGADNTMAKVFPNYALTPVDLYS